MRNILVLFLFSFFACDAQLPISTGGRPNQPGGVDTSAPILFLSSSDADPLIGGTYITVTVNVGSKPVTGFTSGDIAHTNCTISNFTTVDAFTYTFRASPTIAGAFSVYVPANSCVDLRGTNNVESNHIDRTYINDASLDLQNTTLTLDQHYRGHVASFSDTNDELSSLSVSGMEMLFCKYNVGSTQCANGDNQFNRDIYNFGRCDYGIISFSAADWTDKDALITAVRGGIPPTVTAFKNGDESYASSIMTTNLYSRNSRYENVNQTVPTAYTGLTDVNLSNRGATFRYDYYGKTTNTSYYRGSQSTGDANLASYVSTVISGNGWYNNFVHWHWQVYDYPEHYLTQLIADIGSNDVFLGTANTVAEYYYVKESVTSVSGSGSTLTINHTKDWPSSPYSRIITPVWIKINTTGSNYAGHDLACSNGLRIRKISANVFHIPVLLDFTGSSTSVTVETTTSPNYVNLNVPVIGRTGNSVTVDQACKLTIYKVAKPTSLTNSVTSNAIPTVDNTTVNFTVGTGLTIAVGTALRIKNDASHYFYASVISYNSGTGALSVSCSSNTGTGTFSSWTIEKYFHGVTASVVERNFTYVTSYTITATLDNANYTYYVAAINADGISNLF